jgi:hypothetical protein
MKFSDLRRRAATGLLAAGAALAVATQTCRDEWLRFAGTVDNPGGVITSTRGPAPSPAPGHRLPDFPTIPKANPTPPKLPQGDPLVLPPADPPSFRPSPMPPPPDPLPAPGELFPSPATVRPAIQDMRSWRSRAHDAIRHAAGHLGDSSESTDFAYKVLCFCLEGVVQGQRPSEEETWSFILDVFDLDPTPPVQAAVEDLRALAARVDRASNWAEVAADLLVTLSCQAGGS